MIRPKFGWTVTSIGVLLVSSGIVWAAVSTIPQSALSPSNNKYYTDVIGGGIGTSSIMGPNDDGSSAVQNFGFTFAFFGQNYTQYFINNNGNISFGNSIAAYTPAGPQGATQPIISPFFADVDTRGTGSGLVYVRNDIPNEVIITWDNVGYYSAHTDKLDSFQLVVRGPGYSVPAGEGQVGFFYKGMGWETGDASGGSGGFFGTPAAVGFGDGASNGYVLQGSTTNGISAVVNQKQLWFNLQNGVPVVTGGTPASVPAVSPWGLAILGIVILGAGQYLLSRRDADGMQS